MMRFIRMLVARISLALLFFVSTGVYAQMKPEEEFKHYKNKYPDEAVIFVDKSTSVDYSIVNDSIKTTITIYEETIHLGDNTTRYAKESVYSSSFNKVSKLKAYTLIPHKKKYKKLEVEEFKESFDKDSYVFYDDSKETTFIFPAIQKGAKTVMEYQITKTEPKLMNRFYFDTYIPVAKSSYTIEHDNSITINPQYFNIDKIKLEKDEQKVSDTRSRILFTASDIDKIKFDSNGPSYSYLASSIYSPASYFTKSDGSKEYVISDVENLHNWYRTFVADILGKEDEVATLVNSIVSPDDSEIEKVKKIYYWVQDNIKYIAFEDGMRGFVPHSGAYVLNNRYGDCKDMASAIVSMLREVDIEAYYTWVGSRDLPYTYTETPSPITDNHMIATFKSGDKTYYLDATGPYTTIDFPTTMIQGKECLISLSEKEFEIQEIPVIEKEKNVMTDSVNIMIENGTVKGTGLVTLTGYAKAANSYRLIKSNPKAIDDYVERLLSKGSNKFEIDNYTLSNVEDISRPIHIDYTFTIPDYYRQIGDDIYINLVLDKTMTDANIENRTVAIENNYKYINRNIVKLALPAGYDISTLPKNVEKQDKNFGYSINYEKTKTSIVVTKEFYVNYLLMDPADFDGWNNIISEYAKASRNAIILSKKQSTNENSN
ncbi:MAG: transglutaminase domain-containing protein [Bacteroidota bacterium]